MFLPARTMDQVGPQSTSSENVAAAEPAMSDAEWRIHESYRAAFRGLPWPQKIALKQIMFQHAGLESSEVQRRLGAENGFADPQKIVGQLEAHDFISTNQMTRAITCNPSLLRYLDRWFKEIPLC